MKESFGNTAGNYWMGLDAIHNLTMSNDTTSLVQLVISPFNTDCNITYSLFKVGGESSGYALTIGGFSSDCPNPLVGDAFQQYNNRKFMTWDNQTDNSQQGMNCAAKLGGAWWYDGTCTCDACLTQADFKWSSGFYSFSLTSVLMTVNC